MGEEVLSSEFSVLSWQSGRACGMRNVECGIVGTGETLEEVLSSEFSVLSYCSQDGRDG